MRLASASHRAAMPGRLFIGLRCMRWRAPVRLAFALATTCVVAAAADAGSGVRGTISLSPACGGAQAEGQACRAAFADVEVRLLGTADAVVATDRTSPAGAYRMSAPAGHYVLKVVTPVKFTRCPSSMVTVQTGAETVVDIDCDSGMR